MSNLSAPRSRPVWIYLCGLCAALLIPILAVAAILTWQFATSEEVRLRRDVANTNTQIVAALERQFAAELAVLRTLATSPTLIRDDYTAFATQVAAISSKDLTGADIVVVNAEGARIFSTSTSVAFGAPAMPAWLLDMKEPTISNIVRGDSFKTSYYMVSVPVVGGPTADRIVARIPLSNIAALLSEQNLDPGYFSSVVDRDNAVLARSEASDRYYGQTLPGAASGPGRDRFEWSGTNPQGVQVYGVVSREPVAGWGITTGIDTGMLHAAFHRTLRWLSALAAAALISGGLIAFLVTNALVKSARRIADGAARMIDGRDVLPLTTPIAEANLIGTALKGASDRLRAQSEALLAANNSLERVVEERTEELKRKSSLLETTLTSMDQGLIVIDDAGRIRLHNRRAAEMTGLPEELLASGATVAETVAFQVRRGDFTTVPADLAIALSRETSSSRQTLVHERAVGGGRTIEIRTVPVEGGGLVRTYTDVSLRKLAELQLEHIARHDVLTDLPNRMHFNEHLAQAIARFRRDNVPFSVLFVDVDNFKSINDAHGHAAGDQVLKEMAERFRSILRMEDTVARLGGDEFAIIQVNSGDRHDGAALARRLLSAMSATYRLDGGDVRAGISIGVASSAVVSDRIDGIVDHADQALYEAKRAGRNCYRVFSVEAIRAVRLTASS